LRINFIVNNIDKHTMRQADVIISDAQTATLNIAVTISTAKMSKFILKYEITGEGGKTPPPFYLITFMMLTLKL